MRNIYGAEKVAESLKSQRVEGRRTAFGRAKEQHERISRKSGALAIGRDEDGNVKETRRLDSFHVIVDKWFVRMSFKREDKEQLAGLSWKDVEAIIREWDAPRKPIGFSTHIITAVRVIKHLREGYKKEIGDTEKTLLGILDVLNAFIADGKAHPSNEEIDDTLNQLREAKQRLEKKKVVLKCVVAMARLETTMRMLEEAKKMRPGKREMQISRACAVFTSVRNRIGQWRDKQIAGIVEWNHQKECALRVERDRWLFSQFSRFAEAGEEVFGYSLFDRNKLRVLEAAREMLREKKPKQSILRYIKANSKLFRVPERERERAEEEIALNEIGVPPRKGEKRIDFLIGHYAWLYRHINKEEWNKAKEKIGYLILFVNANKPRFILDELNKIPDNYLKPTIEALERAVAAFEAEDFEAAKTQFKEAKNLLGAIAYPKP